MADAEAMRESVRRCVREPACRKPQLVRYPREPESTCAAAVANPVRHPRGTPHLPTFRRAEPDFAERDADVRMNFSRDVNSGGVGQRLAALRLEGIFGRDHKYTFIYKPAGKSWRENGAFPSPALPGAGSMGLSRIPSGHSQPSRRHSLTATGRLPCDELNPRTDW